MASYRHLARTCVMQTIFAIEFNGGDPEKLLSKILNEFAPKLTETDFAYETLKGILSKRDEIIQFIQKYAPEWPIDKIAPLDRSILTVGIYEIIYSENVPAVVAINEAVEIAKHFGDENTPRFVNGVLSSIMNENKKD